MFLVENTKEFSKIVAKINENYVEECLPNMQ